MKNESVLIFIDGTICDDRHRINLYGTDEFYSEENVLNDKPVADSVKFTNELAERYDIIYIGARPENMLSITYKWLDMHGFPKGKVFLATEQSERIKIVESILVNENIILGIGDRWDDNQLHLILGCKSVIVKEYQGDFEFIKKYI
ncbi:MAG: hypothetical protein HDR20_10690 [Lachnospiraceae bacterium]|nr:hypothetical protein [Lachnospiraceae bacterium]